MDKRDISFKDCDKTCPRDCDIMNKILLREAMIGDMYVELLKACDYPDVHDFVRHMLEERNVNISRFERSLNRMYSSFDPSGC